MSLRYFPDLGGVFLAGLLFTNAVAILNEERFLARIGWSTRGRPAANSGFGNIPDSYDAPVPGGESIKTKAINLISAVRTVLRVPLIAVNVIVILYLMVFG